MTVIVGLAMVFAALLIGRAAKVGVQMQPQPWWAADAMNAYIVVPLIVTGLGAGAASLLSWAASGEWRTTSMYVIASLAVVIAVYVAAGRLISAWSRRVLPVAEVVPLAAAQPGPDQPPRVPPLKKAA
jgi:ABC-type spermidine/putrescine transport system permease subunit II